jgi:trehalose 6-phosphate synthase/phosphatase
VIVSGRPAPTLEEWFAEIPVGLVAEHGARSRDASGGWSDAFVASGPWRVAVESLMQEFADRLPGSFVEGKEFSVAWHYRGADDELGPVRARELVEALREVRGATGVHVLAGNRVVEARPLGATKGDAASRWIARSAPEFLFAAGDDATDEDMFRVLPEEAWSVRIGLADSRARYALETPERLRALLESLVPDLR